ncbi:MAG TPA: glycosyltransferase family 4 protein [Candidatus Bathyarchaeia archaeon]|nr:glycosyltransferase family 4 protein [Candidatus Bathyarchaeia archaeon]
MTSRPADAPIDVLVLSSLPPALGGGELQTMVQLKELVRRGHRVTAIDTRPRHDGPSEEDVDGVRVLRIRTPRAPVLRTIAFHTRLAGLVLRHGRRAGVAHVNHVGTALSTAGPLLGLLSVPRLLCMWGSSAPGVGPFGPGWRKAIARAAARRCECTVGLATASLRYLAEHGFDPARLRFIPNGIVVERFAARETPRPEGWPPAGPVAVTVGRLVEAKGLDVLLAAWRKVRDRVPDAHLVLAGDGPLRAALTEQAARLGLGGSVVFLGARRDVPDLLQRADVYVSASRTEGMSNALLEALASGCATVATRVGAAEDLIVDRASGLLVPPGEVGPLSDALVELLLQDELRVRLGAAARRRARDEFSIESVVARYEDTYRELMRPPRPA